MKKRRQVKCQPRQATEKLSRREEDIMEKEKDKKSLMDLGDLQTIVEHSTRKIRFITESFSHNVPNGELFSENAMGGFHFILNDVEDDLELVSDQLCKAGLTTPIMEKTEAT